jgi:hypothetical protein
MESPAAIENITSVRQSAGDVAGPSGSKAASIALQAAGFVAIFDTPRGKIALNALT